MAYWLVKSEPSAYSWDQLVKEKSTSWDGVRNYAARNHLRTMKKNDAVFYYHSNEGTEIVGIAKVSKTAYQDPTTDNSNWVSVELKPGKKLRRPVGLAEIKADKTLKEMVLVKNSRLSVQQVTEAEWKRVLELSSGDQDS